MPEKNNKKQNNEKKTIESFNNATKEQKEEFVKALENVLKKSK